MENKEKKSILIDTTILLDDLSQQSEGLYSKPFVYSLINEMLNDELVHWEIFLIGFNDLSHNLIEIGFSSFAIEEIKERIDFVSLGKPIKKSEFNSKIWKLIDQTVYEIEPDIFQSFNFRRGLPSNPNIPHSFDNLRTIVYLPSIKTDFISPKFNIFRISNFLRGLKYKKMFSGIVEAERILVPNQTVKQNLIELEPSTEDRVEIFYPGINKEFTTEKESLTEEELDNIGSIYGIEAGKYILSDYSFENEEEIDLFIGILNDLYIKKNFDNIAAQILLVGKDFYKGKWESIEARTNIGTMVYRKLKENDLLKYVVTSGTLSDNDFVPILDNATAYILITKNNGFHFGPIKAMSQGVPVFVDNADILATNMENFVNIIDSSKPASASKTIIEILSDEEEVKKQRKKSRKASKKYSWEGAVTRYIKMIKTILNTTETA